MVYQEGKYSRIDYFSFKVLFDLFDYQFSDLKIKLFQLLHVKENEYDNFNDGQFYDCRKYKFNITIKGSPNESASRSDGKNYYCIVLTGDSCEYIRECGTSFVEIIDYINYLNKLVLINDSGNTKVVVYDDVSDLNKLIYFLGAEVSRYDVAIDLVNNEFFTLEQLKEKIINKQFVSRFRARLDILNRVNYQLNETLLKGWQGDEVDFNMKNNKKGFSALWGSKASLQLNIYDKLAEVYAKTKELLPTDEIIRFEVRFGTNKANYNYQEMFEYLKEDKIDKYIGCILIQILRFIDGSKAKLKRLEKVSNLNRADTWKPYEDFINALCNDELDELKLGSKVKYPMSNDLNKNLDWLNSSVYNALMKVACLTDNDELMKIVLREAILKSFQKGRLNNDCNSCLNEFGKDYDLNSMTLLARWKLARSKYVALGGKPNDFKISYDLWKENFANQIPYESGFVSRKKEF